MNKIYERPVICIVGDPGAGKTRLAALWPDPLFLDLENGAGTAVPPERRIVIDVGDKTLYNVRDYVNQLIAAPYEDRRITYNKIPVGGIVIDSLDALQQVHKYENLNRTKSSDPRQMWGTLLDDMIKLVFATQKLKVPVIWVAHAKSTEPVFDNTILKKPGWRGIATQGALEDQILRWFTYCLHIYVEDNFVRRCFTQPTIHDSYKITAAKDRHSLFRSMDKATFIMKADEKGYPTTEAMKTIYEAHEY